MSGLSLQQVMNAMAQGQLSVASPDNLTGFSSNILAPLSEMDAFLTLDSVLAHLHKEFLDAKAQYGRLVKENGPQDAMTEVAADMMDSAWCAMQTRYLEVRSIRHLMQEAQMMMRQSIKAIEEKREKEKAKEALALYYKMQILKRMQLQQKEKVPFFELAFVMMLFKLLPSGFETTQPYRAIAA